MCNWIAKHAVVSLKSLIHIFICRITSICCVVLVVDMSLNMNFEGQEKLIQTQLWKTFQFFHLTPFRDVTTAKRLMWSNQDIRRWPLVHTTFVAIWWWIFIFFFSMWLWPPLDHVNVIETSINFTESRPVQFLPVVWRAGDVGTTNSFVFIRSKWVISVSQLQALGSLATESTSNDKWGGGGSRYSTCQPTTLVQMRAPFTVDEPTNRVGLHTIFALPYSIIGNSS
jgi:hypothetical protein